MSASFAVSPSRTSRFQRGLDAVIVICLGLTPSFHLVALQLATLCVFISVVLRARHLWRDLPPLRWPHILIAQFVLFYTLNAVVFPSLEGNMFHFRRVALESWAMTIFGFVLLWAYLGGLGSSDGRDLRATLIRWLPPGLFISFVVMSVFFFGPQGARAQAYAPNTLVPPIWFLVLTLVSFCWFHDLSRPQKLIRIGLMAMAALMALYSGGRMVLALWALSGAALGVHLMVTRPAQDPGQRRHKRDIGLVLLALLVSLAVLFIVDQSIGGSLVRRFGYTLDSLRADGLSSERFFRLEIWDAALQVVAAHWPLGAGQVNERLLIHQIIDREWWFRSHQTYLSYLIAGGLPALLSGLLFQASGLAFVSRAMMPAALGLFAVLGLSGFTDSVFQSFFSVQLYMLVLVLTLAADQRRQG